tara:strand:- start:5197 stop:6006 length:810 start_codon:yes stop_codon:yes gene_type:complete
MKRVAFTLGLNGMKFLPDQMKTIPKLFDKWYIIEGPVKSVNCTSWCNDIPPQYINGVNMSSDGTYEYLNGLDNPKIEVIRTPLVNGKHRYWNGKVEMCNSFMGKVEDSILMQIDMDEFWSKNTIDKISDKLEESPCFPNKSIGMIFKCNFFVGPNLVTVGNNCYGDMNYEWNRAWKINGKATWLTHEPPKLDTTTGYITKKWTCDNDIGFRHHAYMYEDQVKFKEDYYGYKGAVDGWKRLQNETKFPVYLRDYFPWVKDNTQVMRIGDI